MGVCESREPNDDDTSLTLEFTTLSSCQLMRVAGRGGVVRMQGSSLGDYRSEYIIVLDIMQRVNHHHPKIFK